MLTMTATQADRNSKLERDTLCSKPRDRRYFALVISGECLCSKALVIRSFLQQGLRPGANRTVVTQLEKLQFFWQLAMQQKNKNPFIVTQLLEASSLLKDLVSIPVQT